MRRIFKYEIDAYAYGQREQTIEMPRGAQVLDVQNQDGHLVFWAMVDPEQPMMRHRFYVLPTGAEVPTDPETGFPEAHHCGTAQFDWLVLHVWLDYREGDVVTRPAPERGE